MPRDTLTADQIVKAAIELLDAEGLDGLNMRSLGTRLGSAATAVYWHVKSKDNLVRLAVDEAWQEIELPDLGTLYWRTAAKAMATSQHAMMARHPWVVQALTGYLLYGPAKARHDDHILAVYEQAGFTGAEADRAAAAVFTYVLGNSVGAASTVALTRRLGRGGEERMANAVAEATELAMPYPRLWARLQHDGSGSGYGESPDDSFELGLEALLDGLSARRPA
jgi:AcrR family transcriptional regulator